MRSCIFPTLTIYMLYILYRVEKKPDLSFSLSWAYPGYPEPTGCGSWVRSLPNRQGVQGAALGPWWGPGAEPWWGSMGRSPRKICDFRQFWTYFDAFWCIKISNYNKYFVMILHCFHEEVLPDFDAF